MPRNGSGTYTLPQPPFVPQTTISSGAVNSDFSDIADALTGSVARDGQTAMTGALKIANEGLVYANDPNTGLLRTAADTQALRVGGVDYEFETDNLTIPGDLTLTDGDIITPDGANTSFIVGVPYPWMGSTAPTGCILLYGQAISRLGNPKLFAICGTTYGAGDGSTTFNVPDMRDVAIAGKGDMGGTDRALLTAANFGSDPKVLGSTGGAESTAMAPANLIEHDHSVFLHDPAHDHPFTGVKVILGFQNAGGSGLITQSDNTGSATTGITLWSDGDGIGSQNKVGKTGSATPTPMRTVQPTIIYNWITRAA